MNIIIILMATECFLAVPSDWINPPSYFLDYTDMEERLYIDSSKHPPQKPMVAPMVTSGVNRASLRRSNPERITQPVRRNTSVRK